jgi:competence protein ComEC
MRARIFTIWLISFILGSIVAVLFEPAPQIYMFLGLVLVISSFFIFNRRYFFAVIFAVGIFFLSICSFQYKEMSLVHKNEVISAKQVTIKGVISGIPTVSEFGQTITMNTIRVNNMPEVAKLKLYAPTFPSFEPGQTLVFETKVKSYQNKKWRLIKDNFVGEANLGDYSIVTSKRDVIAIIKEWLFALRYKFNTVISRSLPSAESGLASGLILGEKALITPEVTRQLQISGTTHIIALSGYNITIILGLFVYLQGRLSRFANLLVPLLFIISFVVMTGGAASLIRASIMGFMPLIASYLGRENDSFIAILFSATAMIAFNPFLALFDVGFQLSFVALAGMIYLAPIIARLLVTLPKYLSVPLSETVGAQVAAAPLLAYYFGSISVISPIANLMILSLVPLGMLIAFLIGLAGVIWQGLANFLAIPGYVILHTINSLVAFFGSLPTASKSIKIENQIWIPLIYTFLFGLWLALKRAKQIEMA